MIRPLKNWFRRDRLEQDLARELRYHHDRKVGDLIATGMPEAEARRQATIEMGGLTQVKEEVRDVWFTRWIRDFAYDLRFSLRGFLRNPSFTATVVLSLALGIGATTAIYSLVDQVVLRALPVPHPEQLVLFDWKGPQLAPGMGSYNIHSYALCRDLHKQSHLFQGVFCRHTTEVNISTAGISPRFVSGEIVSGTYFPVLGVPAALGRVIDDRDDAEGKSAPVVVLSHAFWKTNFGGDPGVIGKSLLINKHPMSIIGVAAETFHGVDVGNTPALWVPAAANDKVLTGWRPKLTDRRTRWMQVLGRLYPGTTARQAQTALQPWFKAMLEDDTKLDGFPRVTEEDRARFLASTLEVTAAAQGHSVLRRGLEEPLWVLFAATAVLLTLACLNVAGLFLARGSAREREVHTRMALGASHSRVGRQLLADSLILALAGGALAMVIAPLIMRTLIAFQARDIQSNHLNSSIDLKVLLFAFAVSIAAGALSGIAPAWQTGRASLVAALRERRGTGSGGARLRRILITVQIAFTLILVIGAALFVRTLNGLRDKGPGFETSSLVSFGLDPVRNGYTREETNRLIQRIHNDIRNLPSTQSAAIASVQLLQGGSWNNNMTILAKQRMTTERSVHMNRVSPEFFTTLQARVIAGRGFDVRDTRPSSEPDKPRSVIINETYAKRYFRDQSPIGALVCDRTGPDAKPDTEIIGVVSDISYRGIREQSEQAFYPAIAGGGDTSGNFYVRWRGNADTAIPVLRGLVRAADPELPVVYMRTLDETVQRSLSNERMLATVSGGFGTLALVLSLVGLYGVMSFVVTQRTREIGVRLALGATRASALWMVMRDAGHMIAIGTSIALPCVMLLGRLVQSQLYGVEPTDIRTVGAATLILALTSLGAALLPAYRASSIDPTEALRAE